MSSAVVARHLPSTGVQWLVLRGLAWTLAFALSFVPSLADATGRCGARRRRARRPRPSPAPPAAPARASGAVMLAFTGLLLPGLLLLHTGHLPAQAAATHSTQVVRKVVVRRVVHERTVAVREVAPALRRALGARAAPVAAAKPVAKSPAKKQAPAKKVAAKPAPTATTTATPG